MNREVQLTKRYTRESVSIYTAPAWKKTDLLTKTKWKVGNSGRPNAESQLSSSTAQERLHTKHAEEAKVDGVIDEHISLPGETAKLTPGLYSDLLRHQFGQP